MLKHKWFDDRSKKFIVINDEIRARNVLLVEEDWTKLWVFSLEEALKRWQSESKDLIQIWYNAEEKIAIVKFMDMWKFLYQQKKQESEKKKTQKSNLQKEVKFWYNIWENDLKLKLNKILEFLGEWNSVKLMWVLKWRENFYKDKMYMKMKAIVTELEPSSKNQWIKLEKNWYSVVLFPKGKN